MLIDYSALVESAAVIIALPLSLLISLPKQLPLKVTRYVLENVAIAMVLLSISIILGVLELWPAIIFLTVALAYLAAAIAWITMTLHKIPETRQY